MARRATSPTMSACGCYRRASVIPGMHVRGTETGAHKNEEPAQDGPGKSKTLKAQARSAL